MSPREGERAMGLDPRPRSDQPRHQVGTAPPTTRCRPRTPDSSSARPAGLDSDAGGDRHGQNLAADGPGGPIPLRVSTGRRECRRAPRFRCSLLPRRRLGDRRSRHARRSVPADHGRGGASQSSPSTTGWAGAQVPAAVDDAWAATRWVVAHAKRARPRWPGGRRRRRLAPAVTSPRSWRAWHADAAGPPSRFRCSSTP